MLSSVHPRAELDQKESILGVNRKLHLPIENLLSSWSFLSPGGFEGENWGEAESEKDTLGPWTAPSAPPSSLLGS